MKELTTREFSKATGIAQGTLRRWAAEGVLIPAHANGKGKPALYSEAQLQADAVLNFKPRALTVQDETANLSLSDRVNRIRKLSGDTARNLIEIGKHLTAAKDELPHGDFSAWVQDNFGWTIRTAQNLMAVAERFGDMDIANFKPSHLQALLALPSGDEQKFIAEQAAAGQPVETQSARQLKENIKQHNRQKSKGTKAKTFSHLEPTNPAITPTSNALSDLEHVDEAPAVIDVDAAISYSKQKTQSVTIHSVPVKDTTPTSFEVKIVKADIPEHLKKTQYTICTQPQIFSATNSETVTTSGDNTATDSPADETADALIDSELADIFALIDKITDADKLRRIQAHISERLAEIDGKKISLPIPTQAANKKL